MYGGGGYGGYGGGGGFGSSGGGFGSSGGGYGGSGFGSSGGGFGSSNGGFGSSGGGFGSSGGGFGGGFNSPSPTPRGFSLDDFSQKKMPFLGDGFKPTYLPRATVARPTGRAIYLQRKEYTEELNKKLDNLHARVEHVFTCNLDGKELKTMEDCLAKLKRLDAKGRLWPQEMIMEVQGEYLLLTDIETKSELDAVPLTSISQTKAVLDSCAYNSLLILSVQKRKKRQAQVMMFQCEETGAELLKIELDNDLDKEDEDPEPQKEPPDNRTNLNNVNGQQNPGRFKAKAPPPLQPSWSPTPQEIVPPTWADDMFPPRPYTPPQKHYPPQQHFPSQQNVPPQQNFPPQQHVPSQQQYPQEMMQHSDLYDARNSPEVPPDLPEIQKNTDVFNQIVQDLEHFLDKLNPTVNPGLQPGMKKTKSTRLVIPPTVAALPSWVEYTSCLQKIKYGFNLLSQLEGSLTNPSASEFVHIFFSALRAMVSRYPPDLPSTVVSPLLTDSAKVMLSQELSLDEMQFWQSLGDSWTISRSKWPTDDVPIYVPYQNSQPQPPTNRPSPPLRRPSPPPHRPASRRPSPTPQSPVIRRPSPPPRRLSPTPHSPPARRPSPMLYETRGANNPYLPVGHPSRPNDNAQNYQSRSSVPQPNESQTDGLHSPLPANEPLTQVRAMYDFRARNNQELTVMKDEVVEVVRKTNQWWTVRNQHNEEGNVPHNILEPVSGTRPMEAPSWDNRGQVTLDVNSSAGDVRAWLESKGFSRITISSLGVLTGKLLLGMSKEEIMAVCPEEGGKVFFHLQGLKSTAALASEPQYSQY